MGFTGEEYLGRSYNEYHLPDEIRGFTRDFAEVISTGKSIQREHKSRRDGKYFLQTLSPVVDPAGEIAGVTVVSKDIDALKQMENKFHALSVTDELTGLFNRRGFFTVADQYLKLADRNKRGTFMLYVDLDGLKQINDKFGHNAGDLALTELANLLKKSFRSSDAIAASVEMNLWSFRLKLLKTTLRLLLHALETLCRVTMKKETMTLCYWHA